MESSTTPHRWRQIFRALVSVAVLALLAVALWTLKRELTQFRWSDMWASVMMIPLWKLGVAILAAIASYAAIAGYGVITFRYAGHPLHFVRSTVVSFIIATFSLNLGAAVLTSNLARARLLTAEGFSPAQIVRSSLAYGAIVLVGPMLLAGVALTWSPLPLPPDLPFDQNTTNWFGLILLVLSLAAIIGLAVRSKPLAFRNWSLQMPTLRQVGQGVFYGALEWFFAAFVLAAVLPETGLPLAHLLSIIFLAQLAAVMSGVPGGLGVFEVVIVALMPESVSQSELLGSILLYRALYLMGPFAIALILFAWLEVRSSRLQSNPSVKA